MSSFFTICNRLDSKDFRGDDLVKAILACFICILVGTAVYADGNVVWSGIFYTLAFIYGAVAVWQSALYICYPNSKKSTL